MVHCVDRKQQETITMVKRNSLHSRMR